MIYRGHQPSSQQFTGTLNLTDSYEILSCGVFKIASHTFNGPFLSMREDFHLPSSLVSNILQYSLYSS